MSKRIVCTDQVPLGNHPKCARIVSVGVSDGGDQANAQLSVEQVIAAMDNGVQFYTYGNRSGKAAAVLKYWCSSCLRYHIRSAPDAVEDNNLDSLRYCSWKAAA